MVTPEILAFVRGEQGKGVSRELITNILKTQGWTDADIAEIFSSVPSVMPGAISTFSSPKPYKHKKLIFSIIAIIIVLASGAFFYASGYFTPMTEVFSKSLESTKNTTGATFDMHITVDASEFKSMDELGLSDKADFNIKGSYDTSNTENIKLTSSMMFQSGTLEAGIDVKTVDGSLYLNLTKAPNIGFFSLKPFENKWVVYPYKAEALKNNPVYSSLGITPSAVNSLTKAEKSRIAEISKNANFIKITKKHFPQTVDGVLSFHFEFDLDKAGIIAYTKELVSYIKSLDKNKSDLPQIPEEEYNKLLDSLQDFHGEAWIGMVDKLPHKITFSSRISDPSKSSNGSVKINASLTYKDWNKPLVVEPPKKTSTIEELMSSGMGGSESMPVDRSSLPAHEAPDLETSIDPLSDARNKGVDAAMKSILSSMRAQAELYYDSTSNSYKGFCTSKGEYGAYKLAVGLPKNTVYKCNDNATSWASGVRLSVEGYWCVDSTGYAGVANSIPKGTSCN